MESKFMINRLSKDELTYELKFRGVTDVTTVSEMRKCLRNLFKLELQTSDISEMHYPPYPYTFAEDIAYVKDKISELSAIVKDFADSDKSSAFEQTSTKLIHIFQRASRANASADDEFSERQRVILSIMNLQSDLKSRARRYKKLSAEAHTPLELSVLMSSTGVASGSSSDSSSDESESDSPPALAAMTTQVATTSNTCQHHSVNNIVPVYKWNLTKFDGKKSTISLCAFLEQVEELQVSRNVSVDQLFRAAGDLFTGKAKVWYNGMRNQVHSWDELVRELRLQYLGSSSEYNRELLKEIRQRSQHPDEPIGIYIACMNTLFNRLTVPVNDKARLEILLENLAPYYKRELGMTDIHSVDQLLQLGRKAESNKRAIESYVPPPRRKDFLEPDLAYIYSDNATSVPSTSSANSASLAELICWNCKSSGHIAKNCRSGTKNKYCFRCGNANYTVRTCPKCNSGNALRRN